MEHINKIQILKLLVINNTQVIDPLQHLYKLKTISTYSTSIIDMYLLTKLTQLQDLSIFNNIELENIILKLQSNLNLHLPNLTEYNCDRTESVFNSNILQFSPVQFEEVLEGTGRFYQLKRCFEHQLQDQRITKSISTFTMKQKTK
ncbi:Hypothetical_protein [Hexamita inflata]|uniref:Hypothetical_protein n=1 Tax=Hexamita inflata TaxID=28002 RepID=A0AA86V3S8_9EUKA|nr:Hypothetical protein HINF_LOCUS62777 [Hexamita inflata]